MGYYRSIPFRIGVIRSYVFVRTDMVRHFYYGGKDTIMSILLAVLGGSVWSLVVYLICTWLCE